MPTNNSLAALAKIEIGLHKKFWKRDACTSQAERDQMDLEIAADRALLNARLDELKRY